MHFSIDDGNITITIDSSTIFMENTENGDGEVTSNESIGLGLMLLEKICEHMNWALTIELKNNGMKVTLDLCV